jgi:dephospho-CoA kinase
MQGPAVIGVTGGVACGKSTVSAIFAQLGAAVIDTDVIARDLVKVGSDGLGELISAFGPGILAADQSLDRSHLRALVFASPAARHRLDSILHPRIQAEAQRQVSSVRQSPYIALVVPLLVESGKYGWVDRVLVIDQPRAMQEQMLVGRDRIERNLAIAMIEAQASRGTRLAIADDVIRNSGSLAQLQQQTLVVDRRYRALFLGREGSPSQ